MSGTCQKPDLKYNEEYGKLANNIEDIFGVQLEERVAYGLSIKMAIANCKLFLFAMQFGH